MDTLKIGKFIARCRKEKKMTQEDLAKILGVTNKTISRWENGNYMPDLSLLKPLSEVLGISLNELLSGEKDINVQKADENIFNITNYSRLAIEKVFKHIYIALMFLGLFLIISALLVTEPESSFGAIYTTIGLCMFIIGFNHWLKKYKVIWQWVLTFAVTLFCIGCLLFFDYVNVVENRSVPRFRLSVIYTSDNIIGLNIGNEIEFINTSGWLVKKYIANQEITKVSVSSSLAAIVYRDKVEILNL